MPSAPKVALSKDLLTRLQYLEHEVTGNLFGHLNDGTLIVAGFGLLGNDPKSIKACLNNVPSEIRLCGAFTTTPNLKEAQNYFSEISKNVECYDTPVFLTSVMDRLQAHISLNGVPTITKVTTVTGTEITATNVYFYTVAELSLDAELTQQGIKQCLEDVKKKVLSNDVGFMMPSTGLFLTGATSEHICGMPGITADSKVKELFEAQPPYSKQCDVVVCNMHLKKTKEQDEKGQSIAPVIRQIRRSFENVRMCIKVDAFALVNHNAKVGGLFSVLTKSFLHGLGLVEVNLLQQLTEGKRESISNPEAFHFRPAQSGYMISVIYPASLSDAELKKQRTILHKNFGYGLDKPLFRRSQAFNIDEARKPGGPLINPHEGLNSGVKGGEASLVKGLYSYYHYLQGKINDDGWGCAYRSLQTIMSWFRLQGFTEVDVPTHKQIQECLVKIGDKPSSFIGSTQWIGSTEVSFVLESMLGVTSKILTVTTGEEVASLGSELTYHFQTHGTPIMIGGGLLAHTIVGVDFNRSTGEIKFLIVDPHYTGADNIATITGKGWVGWKDIHFWKKNAFYNLCLPLRPIGDI